MSTYARFASSILLLAQSGYAQDEQTYVFPQAAASSLVAGWYVDLDRGIKKPGGNARPCLGPAAQLGNGNLHYSSAAIFEVEPAEIKGSDNLGAAAETAGGGGASCCNYQDVDYETFVLSWDSSVNNVIVWQNPTVSGTAKVDGNLKAKISSHFSSHSASSAANAKVEMYMRARIEAGGSDNAAIDVQGAAVANNAATYGSSYGLTIHGFGITVNVGVSSGFNKTKNSVLADVNPMPTQDEDEAVIDFRAEVSAEVNVTSAETPGLLPGGGGANKYVAALAEADATGEVTVTVGAQPVGEVQ